LLLQCVGRLLRQRLEQEQLDRRIGGDVVVAHEADHAPLRDSFDYGLRENLVAVVLRDSLTKAEKSLASASKSDALTKDYMGRGPMPLAPTRSAREVSPKGVGCRVCSALLPGFFLVPSSAERCPTERDGKGSADAPRQHGPDGALATQIANEIVALTKDCMGRGPKLTARIVQGRCRAPSVNRFLLAGGAVDRGK
jgi:hypothetical protein